MVQGAGRRRVPVIDSPFLFPSFLLDSWGCRKEGESRSLAASFFRAFPDKEGVWIAPTFSPPISPALPLFSPPPSRISQDSQRQLLFGPSSPLLRSGKSRPAALSCRCELPPSSFFFPQNSGNLISFFSYSPVLMHRQPFGDPPLMELHPFPFFSCPARFAGLLVLLFPAVTSSMVNPSRFTIFPPRQTKMRRLLGDAPSGRREKNPTTDLLETGMVSSPLLPISLHQVLLVRIFRASPFPDRVVVMLLPCLRARRAPAQLLSFVDFPLLPGRGERAGPCPFFPANLDGRPDDCTEHLRAGKRRPSSCWASCFKTRRYDLFDQGPSFRCRIRAQLPTLFFWDVRQRDGIATLFDIGQS